MTSIGMSAQCWRPYVAMLVDHSWHHVRPVRRDKNGSVDESGQPVQSTEIDAIVDAITANPGQVVAVEVLDRERVSDLVARLQSIYRYGFDVDDGADVRLALGSASSTLERALEQFAAAMQLPYGAARTLWQFSEAVGERPSGYRSCVVVADAVELLADEDEVIWRALADQLVGRPRCMGGGWDTLVFCRRP